MTPSPRVDAVFDPATHTVTYVVSDPATGAAAIIDPVLDFDPASGRTALTSMQMVLDLIDRQGLKLERVLETHAHADHLTAADEIRRARGVEIGIGERIDGVQAGFAALFDMADPGPAVFDQLYADGDRFALGGLEVEVMHTPGHTPASASPSADWRSR